MKAPTGSRFFLPSPAKERARGAGRGERDYPRREAARASLGRKVSVPRVERKAAASSAASLGIGKASVRS